MAQAVMRETTFRSVLAGTSVAPRGIECVFEYNGLVMNDRRRVDQIRITRVSGLDDPDVRDTREVNPDRDGETAFSSLYGGRTISLQGYVQAGNLDYLRFLWRNLKIAFDDISVERDLLMRWYDWRDDFVGDNSILETESVLGDYTFDVGATTLSVSNGQLVPSSTAEKRFFLRYPRFRYIDAQGYLCFTTGTTGAVNDAVVIKNIGGVGHIEAQITQGALGTGTSSLTLNKYTGSNTSLGAGTLTGALPQLAANTTYWLGAKIEGNVLTGQIYTADPDSGAAPVASRAVTLAGGDITTWGANARGSVGARIFPGNTSWRYEALDFRALNPGDLVISCKKSAKFDGEETQDNYLFRRPFMLTLRASNPALRSRSRTSLSGAVALSTLTFPGSGGIAFPVTGGIFFGAALGVANNLGSAPEYPLVRITGPVTNPTVVNTANESRLVIAGDLLAGEYLDIDCDLRTVTDQLGYNKYALVGTQNTWLKLERGANTIVTGADAIGGSAILTWRHAFR